MITLFQYNSKSLEKHYEQMKIKSCTDKGIYFYECKSNLKEEFIIKLFLDKTGKLPVAQNILIANKETSYEELQAFLTRAILCKYRKIWKNKKNYRGKWKKIFSFFVRWKIRKGWYN